MSVRAKVIGNFQPRTLDPATIAQEFAQFCADRGFKLCNSAIFGYSSVEIRSPAHGAGFRKGQHGPFVWHQDGFGPCEGRDRSDGLLVVWSNVGPTRVRPKATGLLRWFKRKQLVAQDGDVLVIENSTCEHSAPISAYRNRSRWFARGHAHRELEHEESEGEESKKAA